MPRRLHIALLLVFSILHSPFSISDATAQTSIKPASRRQLETAYAGWQRSMLAKDLRAWTRATAPYRRAAIRNLIVSQKLPYPAALFSLPFDPPSLVSLRFLAARTNTAAGTAIAVYFGPVDFGVPNPAGRIPDNLYLVHFIRDNDDGAWKFDRTRLLNLAGADMRTRIAGGELDFLSEPDFQPDPAVPPVPALVAPPAHIAHLAIVSIGYETRVRINGDTHETLVVHNATRDLVIGGLAEGKNSITIESKPLLDLPPPPEGVELPENPFQVEVYVMRDRQRLPPARIFNFAPATPPATHSAPLWANAVTIQ